MTRLSRSPDLERLREQGYEVWLHPAGYVVVDGLPYLNAAGEVHSGRLVSELTLSGDVTAQPQDHVVLWAGDPPCDQHGLPLRLGGGPAPQALAPDLVVDRTFSSKPSEKYVDYHHKLSTYATMISAHAAAVDPTATAMTFRHVEEPEDDSPFVYADTSSARGRITGLNEKLKIARVVIVGTGGSGSYILDYVAKSQVRRIDLYDGDRLRQHNAFRAPGAVPIEALRGGPYKADYYAQVYSAIHRGIVPHPYPLEGDALAELDGADFVFLALDDGVAKRPIITRLEERAIPFIDVGMGISESESALGGLLRVTTSRADLPIDGRARISFADPGDNDYRANIQIAELNALNAALAVIRWKRLLGFYRDESNEFFSAFVLDANDLVNEDRERAG